MAERKRLSAEERRGRLVEAAARLIAAAGGVSLSYDALAREAGIARSAAYAAFPDPADLVEAVLAREFEALDAAGLVAASREPDLGAAAAACADIYVRRVAEAGPVAHVILREGAQPAGRWRAWRDGLMRTLARRARRELALPAGEAVAALSLTLVIPEDAGRLAWTGELKPDRATDLCRRLVAAALEGLARASPPSGSSGSSAPL